MRKHENGQDHGYASARPGRAGLQRAARRNRFYRIGFWLLLVGHLVWILRLTSIFY